MKILLTVHQFFPEYFSGTEVLTFSVAKELKKRGHDVSVFTGFPARTHMPEDERFDEYDIDGIHVYRFHHAYIPMGGQSAVTEVEYDSHLTARYFTRMLRDLKPDIVHFFHLSRLGVGLIDATIDAQIPAYYTPTDFWSVCPTSQLLLRDGSVCPGPSKFGEELRETRGRAYTRASRAPCQPTDPDGPGRRDCWSHENWIAAALPHERRDRRHGEPSSVQHQSLELVGCDHFADAVDDGRAYT